MNLTGKEKRLDGYPGTNPRDCYYLVKTDKDSYCMRVKPKTGYVEARRVAESLLEDKVLSVEPIIDVKYC